MDVLDPIFECVPRNDIREGRATMSWKTTAIPLFLLALLSLTFQLMNSLFMYSIFS